MTIKTYTKSEIREKAFTNIKCLVVLYNAHAFMDKMITTMNRTLDKLTIGHMWFSEDETKEILAQIDYEVRDVLD